MSSRAGTAPPGNRSAARHIGSPLPNRSLSLGTFRGRIQPHVDGRTYRLHWTWFLFILSSTRPDEPVTHFPTESPWMHDRTRAITPPERAHAVARHRRIQAAGASTNPKRQCVRLNPSTPSPKRTQAVDSPADANHRQTRSNPSASPPDRRILAADMPMHRPIEAAGMHTRNRATPSPKRTQGADATIDANIGVHVRTKEHGRQVAQCSRLRRRCMDPWERAGCTFEPKPARRTKEPEAPSDPPT